MSFSNSNNNNFNFPPWLIFIIMLFPLAFILVPVGLAAPWAFPIVGGVMIPFFGLASILGYVFIKQSQKNNPLLNQPKSKVDKKKLLYSNKFPNNSSDSKKSAKNIPINMDKQQDFMEISICPYCGVNLSKNARTCPNCGSSIEH